MLVQYGLRGAVAVITIDRADKRNALSRQLIAELTAAVLRAADDSAARCVILTGSGSAFCAGMDLDELRGTLGDEADMVWDDAAKLSALFELIYTLPKPTVAAVNGAAVAGGAGLVTVCDLAISVPTAKFGYPEVRRGLVAAMVLPHLLRHVGERTARWLLLTGELIDATEAKRVGLINDVVTADALLETAMLWCQSLIEGGPKALATTKELLRKCSHQAVPVGDLARASAEPRLTDECRGGLTAFFEKRSAPWANSIIVGIGELLWDIFPDGSKVAGGAPFNFAYHCHQLGHPVAIVSAVGDDKLGRELRDVIQQLGITDEFIKTDSTFATGTVKVKIDSRNQPEYTIANNVAWDAIEWDTKLDSLAKKASVVCHGSLALRSEVTRATTRKLAHTAARSPNHAQCIFDVNLRPPDWDRILLQEPLAESSWVKVSAEELRTLADAYRMDDRKMIKSFLPERHGASVWIITKGSKGVEIVTREKSFEVPAVPAAVVDTVGAGDAFTAACICLVREGRTLSDAATFAVHYAAKVCEHRGATPVISRADVERAAFRKWWRVWS